MYNTEEEEEKHLTDRINITIILILKIRKSLLTIDITDNIDIKHGDIKNKN